MAMHMMQSKNKLNAPTREEYRLALTCVPTIGSHYYKDPAGYLKRQWEEGLIVASGVQWDVEEILPAQTKAPNQGGDVRSLCPSVLLSASRLQS